MISGMIRRLGSAVNFGMALIRINGRLAIYALEGSRCYRFKISKFKI